MKTGARFLAVLSVLALVAVPALGQVSPEDIAEAEAELASIRLETDQLAIQYEAALSRSAQLEDQVAGLETAIQESQIELASTRQLVRARAVEMYIESSLSQISLLFVEDLDGSFEVALGYLEDLGSSDTELLRDLEVIKTEYERQLAELDTARFEQEEVVADLSLIGAQLSARLETAQSTYLTLVAQRAAEERAQAEEAARRRAEELARQAEEADRAAEAARAAAATSTTVSTPVATTTTMATTTTTAGATTSTTGSVDTTTTTTTTDESTATTLPSPPAGGQACPVDGFTSYTDTWGAPRSGGRSHEGVDMLGARWTPLVAIESGTIRSLGSGGLGGISIWLTGASGDRFYYAHMEAWADGLSVGQTVQVGELIGYMGTSGNAPDYIPHLHFEYHPGGGAAANPYPLVKGLCG